MSNRVLILKVRLFFEHAFYSVTFGANIALWLHCEQNRSRTVDKNLRVDKIFIVKHALHVSAYKSIIRRPFYTSKVNTKLHILKDGDLTSCCYILTVVYIIFLSMLLQKPHLTKALCAETCSVFLYNKYFVKNSVFCVVTHWVDTSCCN